jgi:hypothetical protein
MRESKANTANTADSQGAPARKPEEPTSGGSYTRHPDGISLVRNDPPGHHRNEHDELVADEPAQPAGDTNSAS